MKRKRDGGLCKCPGVIMDLKDGTQFECGGCTKYGVYSGKDNGCSAGRFSPFRLGWTEDGICESCKNFFENKDAWPPEIQTEYADQLAVSHKKRGDRLTRGASGSQSGWIELGDPISLFNQRTPPLDCRSLLNASCAHIKNTSPDECNSCAQQLHIQKAGCDEEMARKWCATPPLGDSRGSLGGFTHDPHTSTLFPSMKLGGGKIKRKKTKRKKTKRKKTKRKKTKRKKTNK